MKIVSKVYKYNHTDYCVLELSLLSYKHKKLLRTRLNFFSKGSYMFFFIRFYNRTRRSLYIKLLLWLKKKASYEMAVVNLSRFLHPNILKNNGWGRYPYTDFNTYKFGDASKGLSEIDKKRIVWEFFLETDDPERYFIERTFIERAICHGNENSDEPSCFEVNSLGQDWINGFVSCCTHYPPKRYRKYYNQLASNNELS